MKTTIRTFLVAMTAMLATAGSASAAPQAI
jgi:hypothetical protein